MAPQPEKSRAPAPAAPRRAVPEVDFDLRPAAHPPPEAKASASASAEPEATEPAAAEAESAEAAAADPKAAAAATGPCSARCHECAEGGAGDGGVPLGGRSGAHVCEHWCSSAGHCGTSNAYRQVSGGSDCRACRARHKTRLCFPFIPRVFVRFASVRFSAVRQYCTCSRCLGVCWGTQNCVLTSSHMRKLQRMCL